MISKTLMYEVSVEHVIREVDGRWSMTNAGMNSYADKRSAVVI